jgi:DNA-binding CsgD family transcriptional regulator
MQTMGLGPDRHVEPKHLIGGEALDHVPAPDAEESVPLTVTLGVSEERLDRALERLPAKERDILELAGLGKNQRDIAKLIGLTQPGVSYRFRRAIKRLQFWLSVPELNDSDVIVAFRKLMRRQMNERGQFVPTLRATPKLAVQLNAQLMIMVVFFRTTSQSKTAVETKHKQNTVRRILLAETKAIVKEALTDPSVSDVAKWFDAVVNQGIWGIASEQQHKVSSDGRSATLTAST